MAQTKSETGIAEPVIDWLEGNGWDVYQEVQFYSYSKVADIVAKKGDDLWIVECKRSYRLSVLDQASYWTVTRRSVAVASTMRARPRSWLKVAKEFYKVGVLEIDLRVSERLEAPYLEQFKNFQPDYIKRLSELHKTFAKAGSKGGAHLTNYKVSILSVKEFIKENPGCTTSEIVEALGPLHYAHVKSAKNNLREALVSFEKRWCESWTDPKNAFVTKFKMREVQL